LKQALPTEVPGKDERVLVLHRKFQNLRETLGCVSIFKPNARGVKRVR